MKKISVYTDGGSRNNPGPAGIGYLICDENNKVVYQCGKYIGEQTNNVAEYTALSESLNWLNLNRQMISPVSLITFYSDSELMVKQLTGIYKIKDTKLKPLASEVLAKLKNLNLPWKMQAIPREQNSLADSLVNQALDAQGL